MSGTRTMRYEKVDTRAVLLGGRDCANDTDPTQRAEERARIVDYWPDDMLEDVRSQRYRAPYWRLLLDPTGWHDLAPEEVHEYVRDTVRERGRWPSIDDMHVRFGRASNHRKADRAKAPNPAQEVLI